MPTRPTSSSCSASTDPWGCATPSPRAVRAALASLEMPSILPGGELSFPEANGYQAQGTFVLLQNQPDGSVASVYPRAVATREGTVRSCPAGEAAGQH